MYSRRLGSRMGSNIKYKSIQNILLKIEGFNGGPRRVFLQFRTSRRKIKGNLTSNFVVSPRSIGGWESCPVPGIAAAVSYLLSLFYFVINEMNNVNPSLCHFAQTKL